MGDASRIVSTYYIVRCLSPPFFLLLGCCERNVVLRKQYKKYPADILGIFLSRQRLCSASWHVVKVPKICVRYHVWLAEAIAATQREKWEREEERERVGT